MHVNKILWSRTRTTAMAAAMIALTGTPGSLLVPNLTNPALIIPVVV